MRFALATVVLFSVSASATPLFNRQNVDLVLPACARNCIASTPLHGCSATDDACLCTNQAFQYDLGYCMGATCSPADLEAGLQFDSSVCQGAITAGTPSSTTRTNSATGTSNVAIGTIVCVVAFLVLLGA